MEATLSIVDKRCRKYNAIFGGKLAGSRDPCSGCQATWANFVRTSSLEAPEQKLPSLVGGPGKSSGGGDDQPMVKKLRPHVKLIINGCNEKMRKMLHVLGSSVMNFLPF